MKRKLHQVVRSLIDKHQRTKEQLEYLHKELGIVSDTEIVRYCINKVYKELSQNIIKTGGKQDERQTK